MNEEALFYHALVRSEERGYPVLRRLREKYGSWRSAWENTRPGNDPETEWKELQKFDLRLIMAQDSEFPSLLREIPHPPFAIYLKGSLAPDDRIAIVGTRKATETGRRLAERFGEECGRRTAIVSGLAMGIDASAHQGALVAGGHAIAVLAGGLDRVYPRLNQPLAEAILEGGGALLSEYPPRSEPKSFRFLERNRLVSGLCRGVVIIEASERSGSLATARFATEQNRDVFVVPGPALHPNYKGSHRLIREGAELVVEPAQVLESLGLEAPLSETKPDPAETEAESLVRDALRRSASPLDVDKLSELTHLKVRVVVQTLAFLEIKGFVREEGAGYVFTEV